MPLDLWRKNLRTLRKNLGKTQADIALHLNTTHQTVANWEGGISMPSLTDFIELSNYFGITTDDFINNVQVNAKQIGKNKRENALVNAPEDVQVMSKKASFYGDVMNEPEDGFYRAKPAFLPPKVVTVDSSGRDNVALVHVKARAGYLLGYGDPKYVQKLPTFSLPGLRNGSFRAFEVEGFSMYNTIGPGDIVIGSYVEQARHCRDERVYIFVTKDDGILIKRAINRVDKEGKFILKSDNITDRDQYPITLLDVSQISEIWYVEAVLSKNLRAPSAIYNRLTDLEAELAIIKSKINQKIK